MAKGAYLFFYFDLFELFIENSPINRFFFVDILSREVLHLPLLDLKWIDLCNGGILYAQKLIFKDPFKFNHYIQLKKKKYLL